MTKLSLALTAALAVASFGCKKKGPDCDKAITNSMGLAKADMQKMPGVDDKMLGKLKDLGVQHCKDDKWPDAAITCMTDAKTEPDAQGCYGKLTPDQQEKMQKAMMETMMPPGAAAPPAPPAPTTPTAPAGSDTGSAAGSAATP